ncbi:hypothetical protein ACJX0J_001424 [Zea mays]
MDFFLLLIFDPEPEEVVFLCILSMFYIFNKKRIKSIEILLIQKGEIFVIVLSTGATERYILFLYPFLDYMRPKTRNDKKWGDRLKWFSLGIKKRGTIYL